MGYHAGVTSTPERVAPDVLALARTVSTATLSAQLQKRGFVHVFLDGVLPLRPDMTMAGQAFTLRYIPMREDLERTGEFNTLLTTFLETDQ